MRLNDTLALALALALDRKLTFEMRLNRVGRTVKILRRTATSCSSWSSDEPKTSISAG